ncbi:MAG TPA: chromosomal replication initiator protein DnaA [Anaerolineaceae bacterium]|mgnify:FL=1|jgi:chromosomal replication initiator protein|nr:chromosomal replication initiator protein DnaA [Anaerolineaceae bacterium]HOR83668.1 chromosomal replication initiator protein DnaA [Anaerolineaceae bacterium]HPL43468.1 chromosomal replication initiator protein DnaA [Anaerolineaceae bacterium]HPY33157.1 chromosomal replication initiator protein DnaA [Anaerolineaceae bacterium]HQC21409.1 chromosomal replication initiator protein DnaA [Anaerolineaceae bacterium]
MNAQQAWQAAQGQLQIELSKATYDTWVKQTQLIRFDEAAGVFYLGASNAYACDWLESRLKATLINKLSGMMARSVELEFSVWAAQAVEPPVDELVTTLRAEEVVRDAFETHLAPKYRFDNFVVGPNNRLAHAASLAVAEHPARAYNPLFLYGGVGLGKTHILHAIGNAVLQQGLQVLYVSSEEFTNDLVNAIRTKATAAFREKYRQVDVLLIDDIQFISGKESTQEEFFHTFNTLHGQDKQIVMTSDRAPKAMSTLEERLRSRFEWGLTVDIQPPDFETRLAILRTKAEKANREVPTEIMEMIAREVQANIRELEGAWNRVLAYADLSGEKLTLQLANNAMVDILPQRGTLASNDVIGTVSKYFGISTERILSKDRSKDVALPRQVAMYLMRELGGISLPKIGEELGGRDHTTVMYACDKVADLIEADDRVRRQVLQLREQLIG